MEFESSSEMGFWVFLDWEEERESGGFGNGVEFEVGFG